MGILDAPTTDWRSKPLGTFDPTRDLPGLVLRGWWLADDLTGANGSAVPLWPDRSGRAADVFQPVTTTQPTLVTGTRQAVRFNGSQELDRTTFGSFPAPTTVIAVCSVNTTLGTQRNVVSGPSSTTRHSLYVDATSACLGGFAGAAAFGGQRIDDGAMHILVSKARADGSGQTFTDGYPTGSVSSGMTNAQGSLSFGAGLIGDIREVLYFSGEATPEQIGYIVRNRAAYHGVTVAANSETSLNLTDGTSSNTQPIRYWLPTTYKASTPTPLVIYSHPHQHTYAVNPVGYWLSPAIQALVNEGYLVVSSNGHSVPAGTGATAESWGNQQHIDDTVDAYNFMAGKFNVGPVIMLGASMGGLPSSLAVPDGRIPNIKGVAGIDAVFNLANLFASNTGPYAGFIRAAYGIAADGSDYATKTTGHDPVLKPASGYTGVSWRFYASSADTNVAKANNTDQMATLVAAAPEASVVSLAGGHLHSSHAMGNDLTAFVKRCLAR